MPGVNIRTETRTGPVAAAAPQSARFFVAGLTERGDVESAVRIRSMAEYKAAFGDRVAYGSLYDNLACYFEEGGYEAYVCRVVGDSAAVGTLTLDDGAAEPVDTLRVDAANPGSWSSRITVQVAAGTDSGYKLIIRFDGEVVHTWDNLANPAAAVTAAQSSPYVTITSLGSATSPPLNNPKVVTATALSAGSDDRNSVTASDVAAALSRAGEDLGTGAVACPGYTAAQVGDDLLAYAKASDRIALLAGAFDDTEGEILDAAADLIGAGNEGSGVFYPWVVVPDGPTTRTISPEGYVAACRARAHKQGGAWTVPAGDIAAAKYVIGTATPVDRAMGDRLNDGQVNAIRIIGGKVELYGWRSLSSDEANYSLLIGRDVLNYLTFAGQEVLEPYVFKTIDGRGQLLGRMASSLVGLLDPIRAAGGLYERLDPETGEQLDRGYSVDVGPTVNPDAQLAANKVSAAIAVRVSPVGELIDLTIVKAGLTANV